MRSRHLAPMVPHGSFTPARQPVSQTTTASQRTPGQTPPILHEVSQLTAAAAPLTIQPKMRIGGVGDRYEQEADRVAAQVVQQIHTSPDASSQHEVEPPDHRPDQPEAHPPAISRRSAPAAQAGSLAVTPEVETAIQHARGGGQRLSDAIRTPMERMFKVDLSGVRIHADAQATQLNQSIQARAFTTGRDIFFQQGLYNPTSRAGQELIAHELTHVMQQAHVQPSPSGTTPTPLHAGLSTAAGTTDTIQRDEIEDFAELNASEVVMKAYENKIPKGLNMQLQATYKSSFDKKGFGSEYWATDTANWVLHTHRGPNGGLKAGKIKNWSERFMVGKGGGLDKTRLLRFPGVLEIDGRQENMGTETID